MKNENNNTISEETTKLKYITPAIEDKGWDKNRNEIEMEKNITDGRFLIHGDKANREVPKRADYALMYNNITLAIVEAKAYDHSQMEGLEQAKLYCQMCNCPFAFSSNGKGFEMYDFITGRQTSLPMNCFPSKEELWQKYCDSKNISISPEESEITKAITIPYYFNTLNKKTPRYYQEIAIKKTVEAVARGQDRILVVMATGTGKTFTAFQIVNALRKAGLKKKILYLADRNILIDQTMTQDFAPFQKIMHKVQHRDLDSSYEIYMALYQQLSSTDTGNEPFRNVKPDFFDLIIVDECHRGSAKEDSAWRDILDYFSSATQIGMTATPKETDEVSNIDYFGEPVYTYSLKQGIEDGFLAPYKVIRVTLEKDLYGYTPYDGQLDKYGNEIEQKTYDSSSFDRKLVADDRINIVAEQITNYLKANGDRYQKTIVFCEDIEHAENMAKALRNFNSDITKSCPDYIVRITGDAKTKDANLDKFINPADKFPCIVTTSELMSTGVDCKTCKLIVLDQTINSSIKFKQIIGRGTRIREDYDKKYFTIIDFRNCCRKFADPDFDGEPVQSEEFKANEGPFKKKIVEDENLDVTNKQDNAVNKQQKYYVDDTGTSVLIKRVQIEDPITHKLVTVDLDYFKEKITDNYVSFKEFLSEWNKAARKTAIIDELNKNGLNIKQLRKLVGRNDIDDFDLLCSVAFDIEPLTREQRKQKVYSSGLIEQYSETAQQVLINLLDCYVENGLDDLESFEVLENEPFRKMGSITRIVKFFNGKNNLTKAVNQIENIMYKEEDYNGNIRNN